MINVGIISLGCSKNQVDAEKMLMGLTPDRFALCGELSECDAVVVNTCGFIEAAKQESIDAILSLGVHRGGRLKAVVVTGCLAERYKEELLLEMPEVDVVLGIGSNHLLAESITRAVNGERHSSFGAKSDLQLSGERRILGDSYSVYLKVAEGCDNCCSYCAIPLIRGGFRSRTIEDIVDEAKFLASQGTVELNVVAQDTTRYGEDIYGKLMLPELLEKLSEIDGIEWIRLLYCYPSRVTPELIEAMATLPKVLHYLDIPLQHINDGLLTSMNRRGDSAHIKKVLADMRERMPDIVLRTTFIVGLPNEGEAEFNELMDFVGETRFERLGAFTYSPEEDTPAATMSGQVDEEVKQNRYSELMELQMDIAAVFSRECVGRELKVLCEGYDSDSGFYVGRSYMDAPEVDTFVYFASPTKCDTGKFYNVRIEGVQGYDLEGVRV